MRKFIVCAGHDMKIGHSIPPLPRSGLRSKSIGKFHRHVELQPAITTLSEFFAFVACPCFGRTAFMLRCHWQRKAHQ
jgi:hypothetical protein